MFYDRCSLQIFLTFLASPFVVMASSALLTRPFVLLCVLSTLFFGSLHLVTPTFPLYLQSLDLSPLWVGVLTASFMLASLVVRPWTGLWSDRHGEHGLMRWGALLFTVAALAYPLMHSPGLLLGVRVVQGVGYALFYTASRSYLTRIVPAAHRSEGISYQSNAVKLAMAFAPLLGLWLARHGALPCAFWLAAVFALMSVVLLPWLQPLGSPLRATTTMGGGKLWNRQAEASGVMMGLNSMIFGALIPFAPVLAQSKHLVVSEWFYTVYALALIASRFGTASLADRYGRWVLILPGMALTAFSLLAFLWADNTVGFLVAAALYGFGAGVVQPAIIALMADQTREEERGSANATFTALTDMGQMVGMFAMGFVGNAFGFGWPLVTMAVVLLGVCVACLPQLTGGRGRWGANPAG